jgi:hypothetical protein
MAMTRDELIARVRGSLRDSNAASYNWTESELLAYLEAALADLSVWFPREEETVLALEPGRQVYPLPAGALAVLRVETAEGVVLPPRGAKPKRAWQWSGYEVRPGAIYVRAPGSSVVVHYTATHPLPTSGSDTLSVAERDYELVELYMVARALSRDSAADARLSRWKESGKRDDNPVKPEWQRLMERYERMVAQRRPVVVGQVWRR